MSGGKLTVTRSMQLLTSEVIQVCRIRIVYSLPPTKYLKMHLTVKIVFTVERRRKKKVNSLQVGKTAQLPIQMLPKCITADQIYPNNESVHSILTTDANHENNVQLKKASCAAVILSIYKMR